MLIQCQSCNSKYRLNLERIPNRKTFIKCKKCNAPIYIDPQEDLPPDPQVEPSAAPGGNGGDGELVVLHCDNCDARYRVPRQPLHKPGLKLKCSACGHKFSVPPEFAEAPPPPSAGEEGPPASQEFSPSGGPPSEPPVTERGEQPMPLPDDSRVAGMFDDLQVNPPAAAPRGAWGTSGEDPASLDAPPGESSLTNPLDADRAYLEAVSFGDEGRLGPSIGGGTIPDKQKYSFFLKPGEPPADVPPPALDEEEAFAEGMSSELQDAPPFVAPLAAGAEDDGKAPADHAWDAPVEPPPLDAEAAQDPEIAGAMGIDHNLPAVQAESSSSGATNPPVQGHEVRGDVEKRRFRLLAAAIVLAVLLSVGWGAALLVQPGPSSGYALQAGAPSELAVSPTRGGYFVTNKPSGEKLYVLTGEIVNHFGTGDKVGWIRLAGMVYANGQPLHNGQGYAGNLLNEGQLATWALPAIAAYYGYGNGRNDVNFRIPEGKAVPYQIVLRGVKQPIERSEARVISFLRQGRPVYLEHY